MRYKVGDKVVIKDNITHYIVREWSGKTMTIAMVFDDGYRMKEDESYWKWYEDMIDHTKTAELNRKDDAMKTVKLMIDGKEIELAISEKELAKLTATAKRRTGFEEAENGKNYYFTDETGLVEATANGTMYDIEKYTAANYYTDEKLAEWCCRQEFLNRKMRRWAAEHNGEFGINYHTFTVTKTNEYVNTVLYTAVGKRNLNPYVIYYSAEDVAKAAYEEFKDELVWLNDNRPTTF